MQLTLAMLQCQLCLLSHLNMSSLSMYRISTTGPMNHLRRWTAPSLSNRCAVCVFGLLGFQECMVEQNIYSYLNCTLCYVTKILTEILRLLLYYIHLQLQDKINLVFLVHRCVQLDLLLCLICLRSLKILLPSFSVNHFLTSQIYLVNL